MEILLVVLHASHCYENEYHQKQVRGPDILEVNWGQLRLKQNLKETDGQTDYVDH